jgi:hypothetical protein
MIQTHWLKMQSKWKLNVLATYCRIPCHCCRAIDNCNPPTHIFVSSSLLLQRFERFFNSIHNVHRPHNIYVLYLTMFHVVVDTLSSWNQSLTEETDSWLWEQNWIWHPMLNFHEEQSTPSNVLGFDAWQLQTCWRLAVANIFTSQVST